MTHNPKYKINNRCHAHGTPGTGVIIVIECVAQEYRYKLEYTDANQIKRHKWALERDLIVMDSGEVAG